MDPSGISALGLFLKGGPLMWPILLCSVMALTVFLERFFFVRSIDGAQETFQSRVFDLMKQGQLHACIELCELSRLPIAQILRAGLLKSSAGPEEIKAAIQEAGDLEIPRLERHIDLLAVLGQLVLLLGLLGTVLGICGAFYTIEHRAVALNPITIADFAGGLWQSLLATVAGLLVAIPTVLAHHFLVSRIKDITQDMEQAGTDLVAVLGSLSGARPASPETEVRRFTES